VDNKVFVFLTTVLTFYALIGDDMKLLTTNKPADSIFDIITIVCLFIFTIEITLSCLGKSDYFLGFFFILDVISTLTLLLDISVVSEFLMGDSEGSLDKMRSGRTARVGAKAGRVVRVIRLVRILKLYKAIYEARQQAQLKNDEDDDWGDEDPEEKKKKEQQMMNAAESRVGKKLSEMTTRRVIILVLTMLLVMPFLKAFDNTPVNAFYAADNVLELYMEFNRSRTNTTRLRYERAVLHMMYYNNWYSGNLVDLYADQADTSSGPPTFQSHVFWFGIMSLDETGGSVIIDDDQAWANAQVRSSTVEAFAAQVADTAHIYPLGRMPSIAKRTMSSPWRTACHVPDKGIYRRGLSIIDQEIDGEVMYSVPCPEDLRVFEKSKYYPRNTPAATYEKWHFAFYFDTRPLGSQEATFSLCITSFICVVLCVASLFFSNDANRLVLRPVENMIKRVQIIREDPLVAVKMADEEFKLEQQRMAKERRNKTYYGRANHFQSLRCLQNACKAEVTKEPMETVILEKTIIKLGSLLALGFGEAGANIIGANLESSDSAGVNGMIPGSRVEAIIGCARVRDFSTATEVLKSKVMTFVNQIAEIVHGVCGEFHGAANKNNGDTFLLIWRISGLEDAMVTRMADFSTIAFAKILGSIHRSPTLATYRGHPGLQQRLGGTYRVSLSFGLHAGWAIEGAVGREFKIDASYLSPNVSIAVNVEEVTSWYGVSILMTDSVVELCCATMAKKFRKIDRVIISGSSKPLDVYCLDLDYMALELDEDTSTRPSTWNQRLRFKARQFLEFEKSQKVCFSTLASDMFDHNNDISIMRRGISMNFEQLFKMGYANYFEGEWQVARRMLEKSRLMLRNDDGPSSAILKFMESYKFVAPAHWTGVHDLHIKANQATDLTLIEEEVEDASLLELIQPPSEAMLEALVVPGTDVEVPGTDVEVLEVKPPSEAMLEALVLPGTDVESVIEVLEAF
jgi:class 3 adenylate cyclase